MTTKSLGGTEFGSAATTLHVGRANPASVRKLMDFLCDAYDEYRSTYESELTDVDAFMAVHSFHKAVLFDMANRQELTGEQRRLLLKAAADTFRHAMEAGR